MQTYDVLMLLVLVAAGVWGYWKGFVWQLASLASIFFSYFLAFGLRVQVAKLIDAPPPLNMFAAMGIVYALSSAIIWIGTGFSSDLLATLKLKDFDRQIGATFGVVKGMIFCLLITFFAVTLLGQQQQQRICGSTSGKFIAKLLRSSGGLIPQELHAIVDPFVMPFEQKLEQYQGPQVADASQPPVQNGPSAEQGSLAWNAATALHQAAQQFKHYNYQPQPPAYYQPQYNYDPRYAQPQYEQPTYHQPQYAPPAYDPRYQPAPQYTPPPYSQPQYAAPQYDNYDPRYADPRGYQPPANQAGYYQQPPQYTPQPAWQNDPGYYQR